MTDQAKNGASRDVGRLVLIAMIAAFCANAGFNLVMCMLGFGYPHNSFLFRPDDRWADFFKLAFSYPGDAIQSAVTPWPKQPLIDSHHEMADLYRGTQINPDHLPPLPTLLAVLARRAMSVVDPMLLFLGCLAAGAVALVSTLSSLTRGMAAPWRWLIAAGCSYPLWFMVDRGHFFSFICALTLMSACWRMIESGGMDWRTILLLAIACNLRPNVVVLPAMLVLSGRVGRFADLIKLGFAGATLLLVAMGAAHLLHPHYGLQTWLTGMADYKALYVDRPLNLGYVTSFPSLLQLLFGRAPAIPLACLAFGAMIGLATLVMARTGRLTTPQIMFLCVALMPIMMPAFGDYHLLPFLLPLILLAREGIESRSDWAVFVTCVALLVPKNYLYSTADNLSELWSYQVVLNPIVLLGGVIVVLREAVPMPQTRPLAVPVAQ
jgi:hypothetical protein